MLLGYTEWKAVYANAEKSIWGNEVYIVESFTQCTGKKKFFFETFCFTMTTSTNIG